MPQEVRPEGPERGTHPGKPESLLFVADPPSGRYHLVRLTGNHNADAKRIGKVYRSFGRESSDDSVAERLRNDWEKQTGRVSALKEKAINQPPGAQARLPEATRPASQFRPVANVLKNGREPLSAGRWSLRDDDTCDDNGEVEGPRPRVRNVQWVLRCNGYGYADVQTWELAKYLFPVE